MNSTLLSQVSKEDWDTLDLNTTVVICSTREECNEITVSGDLTDVAVNTLLQTLITMVTHYALPTMSASVDTENVCLTN